MKNLRVAAVVCRSPVGEIEFNLSRTAYWVRQAQKNGVALICFPELNITGYVNHSDMSAYAQPLPGDVSDRLSALAARHRMIILAGVAERSATGKAYASHGIFWPDGRAGYYRKLHLAPNETPYFVPGNDIPVFDTTHAILGIQLCYDAHFPELSTAMTAKGADILFMPHASPRGDAATKHRSWLRHLTARAYDNGVFVVACNQLGENDRGLVFPGNAVVINPSGEVIAKRLENTEGMLVVDLMAAEIEAVRSHPMRYFFPNRRPDLYGR